MHTDHLVSMTIVAITGALADTSVLAEIVPVPGHGCFEIDVDYYGNDLWDGECPNPECCQQQCREVEGCDFWTYETTEGWCWVKHSTGGWREKETRISGPAYCEEPTPAPEPIPEDCYEHAVDFYGNDLWDGDLPNARCCQEMCQKMEGCNYWTFESIQRWCWVKSASAGRREKDSRISGPAYCAPTQPDACAGLNKKKCRRKSACSWDNDASECTSYAIIG